MKPLRKIAAVVIVLAGVGVIALIAVALWQVLLCFVGIIAVTLVCMGASNLFGWAWKELRG